MQNKDIQLIEKYQTSKINDDIDSEDEDELFKQLEDDETEILKFREERMQQLSKEIKEINHLNKENYNVQEIQNEKELMQLILDNPKVVVHFYQENFQQCQHLNSVLELIKENHPLTHIYIIKVENCPFLVAKLNLKVLPVLYIYKNGLEFDKLVGFTKLGNVLNYTNLEYYLIQQKILNKKSINRSSTSHHKFQQDDSEEDSDLDL